MSKIAKIVGGILLIAAGVAIIYESSVYNLIDIFNILGIIAVIFGAFLLILAIFEAINPSNTLNNLVKEQNNKNNKKSNNLNSLNNGFNNEINNDFNNSLANDENSNYTYYQDSKNNSSILESNSQDRISLDTSRIANKVRNVSRPKNPKEVLIPREEESNISSKSFRFTPNYERPMKVTRRPQRKNNGAINGQKSRLFTAPVIDKSEEVTRALAENEFIQPIHQETQQRRSVFENPEVITVDHSLDEDYNSVATSNLQDNTGLNTPDNYPINPRQVDNYFSDTELKTAANELDNQKRYNQNELSSINGSHTYESKPKTYIIHADGDITSKDAFDDMAKSTKKQMLIEIPAIRDIDSEFLSKLSSLDVRMIIQEFDLKDISYVLLITSLLEQNIKIRTMAKVNTINLISDDSQALIMSESSFYNGSDVGAVYDDLESISNIRTMFESAWNLAQDLKINNT